MCEFCESLLDSNRKIAWAVRSTFADDNYYEKISEERRIDTDVAEFEIYGYKHDEKSFLGIGYRQETITGDGNHIIISPFSETIQINFCPVCGQQISDNLINSDDYLNRYRNYIQIQKKD